MRVGSLCQGIGGADLALEAHGHTIAWGAEVDPAPAKVCARHWPDAPNHGDITTIDWSTVEPVDIVSAGFPCPPASTAGKRLGTADERWIWPAVANAINHLRPRYVFAENVRGLLSAPGHPLRDDDRWSMGGAAGQLVPGHAFGAVLRDLAELGYVGAWGVLSSAAVGGCHRRDRLWILAADASGGRCEVGGERHGIASPRFAASQRNHADGRGADDAVDLLPTPTAWLGRRPSHGDGDADRWNDPARSRELSDCIATLDDTFGRYAPAVARWATLFGPPPPPTVTTDARIHLGRKPHLNPAFVEWMMGFPAGWVTDPSLELTRAQQLKALGNAQQPQTAAAAIGILAARLHAHQEAVA